ncbi:threonine aldolase family protein [Chthonobacter rhizosphaerae]|uniref:threonine aldolase family protein n=1 Tax=Chthonobacter rhizosphaerae TaxID=2735553 RepID=UPI0015EEB557|nr:low specificity L-threonine aldolase [Chthonobacter rhizosphaerae]
MNFSSDNWAGASAPVAAAITAATGGLAPAYGTDDATRKVDDWFAEIFERPVGVFFVATGTAANCLSLAAVSKPGGVILCHENAHIANDEAGAPAFFSGGSVLHGIAGARGKITPEGLEAALRRYMPPGVHHGRPVALSLTQATEWGTTYTIDEIAALAEIAHKAGLKVHMDGARFANALVGRSSAAADMTWRAGVDILSFGATKNGCWAAEAIVTFDRKLDEDLAYARKRAGQLFSKSRFVAAQFQGYFDLGHWLDNAVHANGMATRLAASIAEVRGARVLFEPEANEVFAVWPKAYSRRLREAGALFYEWPADGLSADEMPTADEEVVRLVTSFATSKHDVAAFMRALEDGSH